MHVCSVINSLQQGGAETLLVSLVKHSPEDINHTVCHFGWDDTLEQLLTDAGATVVNLDFSMSYDPRGIRRLRHVLSGGVDVLHAHLPPAVIASRMAALGTGVPVVSTHHNVPDNYGGFSRRVERLTRPLDYMTVAVSDGVRHAQPRVPGEEWRTIHNGIDVVGFEERVNGADADVVRNEWGVDADDVLLNIARYSPQKRQTDLARAMHHLRERDAHLFVVGWGNLEGEIHKAAVEAGVAERVTVTGRVPDVEPYYAAADLFVSSSVREGLPITLLEAMAASLPIVATDIPGVRELVSDEVGRLVPPEDPQILAEAIAAVLDDEQTALGASARRRVKAEFDITKTVAAYAELYREVAG